MSHCILTCGGTVYLQVAQGRVWTGGQALDRGLVDHIGGLWRALQVAEELQQVDLHTHSTANNTNTAVNSTSTNNTNATNTSSSALTTNDHSVYKVEILSKRSSSMFNTISSLVHIVSGGNGVRGALRVLKLMQNAVAM